jgi:signal transduction histidine kinase
MDLFFKLIPAGIVVIPALLFFLRPEFRSGPHSLRAGPIWACAWAALFASGLTLGVAGEHPVIHLIGRTADSLFPVLLLAGAYAFADRAIPRWLAPVAVGLILAEAGLAAVFEPARTAAIASLIEAPLELAAARIVWIGSPRGRGGFAERILAAMLLAVAVAEIADIPVRARFGTGSIVLLWLALAVGTGFVQVLVFAERSRTREQQLRKQRALLRSVALPLLGAGGSRDALTAIARVIERSAIFPFFGLWLRSADGSRFDAVEGAATGPIPEALQNPSIDSPMMRAALAATEPIFVDIARDERVAAGARSLGARYGFVAPLRADDRTVGVFGGALAFEPDDDDREIVRDLADEIAVVLANVSLRQTLSQRTGEVSEQASVLRATVDCVPVGIVMTEPGGKIVLMNRSVAQQLDLPDPSYWMGRSGFDLFKAVGERIAPATRRIVDVLIRDYEIEQTARIADFEVRITAPEEKVLVVRTEPVFTTDARQIGRVTVTRDVTHERAIAEHMQHAERMETVGTLAGGLAHDFNNQLTAILGNSRLVLDRLEPDDPNSAALLDLEHCAEHCAELTQGMLAFARQGPASRSAVATEVAIAEVETLLRPTFGPDVRLVSTVASDTPPVAADAFQLRRVLVNLIANGRDAVGERGTIEVWARPAVPDPQQAADQVEIGVHDDGMGMDEATRRRIFDPFFSTKELGRGTGLGLAIVYGIVAAHGGTIHVESEPGHGSTFRIRWPAAPGETMRQSPAALPRLLATRRATILVAEDEPSVRRLTRTALERAGHRVIEALDGDDAVERYAAHSSEIDLALLDLSMPLRNGLDALEAMREIVPGLRAIVMSGHPDRERSRRWPADVAVLPKPFGPRALLDQVDRSLRSDARAKV